MIFFFLKHWRMAVRHLRALAIYEFTTLGVVKPDTSKIKLIEDVEDVAG